jgi:virginiamycin B lyase
MGLLEYINGRFNEDLGGSGNTCYYMGPVVTKYLLDITVGPDGNLWVTDNFGNQIDRITPAGRVTRFALPTPWREPVSITRGPDGNLWFTAAVSHQDKSHPSRIGRMTPTGRITGFPIRGNAFPDRIVAGPDGSLWFTQAHADIGRIALTGVVTEFKKIPANDVTTGPGGSLWFSEDDGVGRIAPSGMETWFAL